jgi:hypothetical protein
LRNGHGGNQLIGHLSSGWQNSIVKAWMENSKIGKNCNLGKCIKTGGRSWNGAPLCPFLALDSVHGCSEKTG